MTNGTDSSIPGILHSYQTLPFIQSQCQCSGTTPIEMTNESQMVHDNETVYTSRTGQVITIVSGSISTLCSFLILYVILRSRNRLTSSYHRIMFSVGFWDIIYSLAMTLTTAPMPVDGVTKDYYSFSGKMFGNTATCDAQGFLYLLGATFSISSVCSLYTYFSATIRFGMKEQIVKRRLLPFCFFISCIISIPAPIFILYKGNINPTPYAAFCSTSTFPVNCIKSNDLIQYDKIERREECIRGDQDTLMVASYYAICGLCLAALTVFVNMALVFHCVVTNTLAIKKFHKLKKNRKNDFLTTGESTTGDQKLPKPPEQAQKQGQEQERGIYVDIDLGDTIDRQDDNNNNPDASDIFKSSSQPNAAGSLTLIKDSKKFREISPQSVEEEDVQLAKALKLRNVILMQASMYIAAFLLCYTIPIINLILEFFQKDHSSNASKAVVHLLLQPLQGFFNALIFISQKAYDFKRAMGGDWLEAFSAVFKTPKEVPEMHFSNVSQLSVDNLNSILPGTNADIFATNVARITSRANIRVKGTKFDSQCISWNDISSNTSNGANSAAVSTSNRSNPPSLGGLSDFTFSKRSWPGDSVEGLSLGPGPSSGIGVSNELDHGDDSEHEHHEHNMQMSDSDRWDRWDDAGLSYA